MGIRSGSAARISYPAWQRPNPFLLSRARVTPIAMKAQEKDPEPDEDAPEGSPAADTPPAVPADDDSPLGDTDQHSDA